MQLNSTLALFKKFPVKMRWSLIALLMAFNVHAQTVSVTPSTLPAFNQSFPSPSYAQAFNVSGTALTTNVTVTAPANYEVSTDKITWSNAVSLTPSGTGALSATPVFARLNASMLGISTGSITVSSTGATTVNIAVTGLTAINSPVLQHWSMYVNNSDSAAERSPGVTASTATFNNLYISRQTATSTTPLPPYSDVYGQAFGASATVDGGWSTGAGGPGGTLRRHFYEQFTVTAASGYSVRVDSISLLAAFNQTASSTKLAIAYSLSGFTTNDSVDVAGASFASPITLTQLSSTGFQSISRALTGATGVTVPAGQTLTIRLYFSCSSSSDGRYGLLKDVVVKGTATNIVNPATITTTGTLSAFNQTLGLPSAVQTYSVSGSNLLSNLIITAPAGYEISANGGSAWNNSSTPIVLNSAGGNVASTNISVRLNAASVGVYNGNIQNISAYTIVNVPVTGNTVATPTILTSGTLTNFTQTAGTPSATQTYSVSGINLTGSITITPPANYEVSADGGITWFNNTTPLILPNTGSNLAATNITVRLNATAAGNYGGNITHTTAGGSQVNVAVSGITASAPTLTLNGTLNPFAQTVGSPSAIQSYTISGSALTGNITITPPVNYEVSVNGTNWFTNSSPLVLTQSAGSVANTTILVRLNAATPGTYSGNILNASSGATSMNVAVTGTVVPAPVLTVSGTLTNFSQTVGTPSVVQTYTVSGANLVSNITITPPANYEVSNNGTNWFTNTNPLVLTPTAGTISTTTISVRLNATAAGTFTGNITNVTLGTATATIPVNGTAVLPPSITVTPTSLTAFTQALGSPSAGKKYTVSGVNLTANVAVTPPTGFEISKDSLTWTSSPITLVQTAGTLTSTTIFVRMNATTAGNYSGNVTHASTGATTRNVAVTGTAPGLVAISAMNPFLQQGISTPSAVQTYTLTGNFLLGNVTITPPAKYQVSIDSGRTWSFNPQTITPVNNSLNMQVYVRLFSGFTGIYNGVIINSTANGASVNVPVNGTSLTSQTYVMYPTPARNVTYFTHPARQAPAKITVYNMAGQTMKVYDAVQGAVETPIDVSNYPCGIYTAVYEIGTTKATIRFVKQ